MAGILLITHNTLGDSLIDCVRHVTGNIPAYLRAIPVFADDDPALKEQEVREQIQQLDQGQGVLILTDIYGATPCNIARRVCEPGKVEGVAGVNLPMLLRVTCNPDMAVHELAQRALQGGQNCIVMLDQDNLTCSPCATNN